MGYQYGFGNSHENFNQDKVRNNNYTGLVHQMRLYLKKKTSILKQYFPKQNTTLSWDQFKLQITPNCTWLKLKRILQQLEKLEKYKAT